MLLLALGLIMLLWERGVGRGIKVQRKTSTLSPSSPNLLWSCVTWYLIRSLLPHRGLWGIHLLLNFLKLNWFFGLQCYLEDFWIFYCHDSYAGGWKLPIKDPRSILEKCQLWRQPGNLPAYCWWDPVRESYLTPLSFLQVIVSFREEVWGHGAWHRARYSLDIHFISSLVTDA